MHKSMRSSVKNELISYTYVNISKCHYLRLILISITIFGIEWKEQNYISNHMFGSEILIAKFIFFNMYYFIILAMGNNL